MSVRRIAAVLVALLLVAAACGAELSVSGGSGQDHLTVMSGDREVLRYQLKKPAEVKLPVDSGGYFHPVTTPSGVVVTDAAPSDHPHHRGIFLAWVEMHGKKDADFWGWGEHAPIKGRRIVNTNLRLREPSSANGFHADSQWRAEGAVMLTEQLDAVAAPGADVNVLDL